MKVSLSLLFTFLAIGLYAAADEPSNNSEYFICTFNDNVTSSEIEELSLQGFRVIEKDSATTVLVVSTLISPAFSEPLKNKMERLVKVDAYGNRTSLNTQHTPNSPEFLKLLFSFI